MDIFFSLANQMWYIRDKALKTNWDLETIEDQIWAVMEHRIIVVIIQNTIVKYLYSVHEII